MRLDETAKKLKGLGRETFYNVRSKKSGEYDVEKIEQIRTKHGTRSMAIAHDESGQKMVKFVKKR